MNNTLHPTEMAQILYNLCCDMDFADYEENREKELQELEAAFYQLSAICENRFNSDFWRTLYTALSLLFEKLDKER